MTFIASYGILHHMSKKKVMISVLIDPNDRDRLKRLARKKSVEQNADITMSDLVRKAIKRELKNEDTKTQG